MARSSASRRFDRKPPRSQTPVWERMARSSASRRFDSLEAELLDLRSQTGVWERGAFLSMNSLRLCASVVGSRFALALARLSLYTSPDGLIIYARKSAMKPVLEWLGNNHAKFVRDLADQVAIPSISTDGEHQSEIDKSASLTCEQMREAGLQNVQVLRTTESNPYAYGEWLGAPGKPTVFLYAHHDVQPVNDVGDVKWSSDPWRLTQRDGRLYGRGSADDKGAITAELAAISAHLKTQGRLPVNIKMLVEGEEEVGSSNLMGFFEQHKELIQSYVIFVCDSENIEVGIPSITYSLRGIVAVQVEVRSAKTPVHSGMAGGALADAALALNVI